jgi:hypothetical protein
MREKIFALLLTAFLVSGIKAIPKDSVIYSFKAGVISPYCFKYKRYGNVATASHSYPFNSGFTLGLDASGKNFSLEFSLDHSSFRRISHYMIFDSITEVTDLSYQLTQVRFFPKYRIFNKSNSSLDIGCGITMARPSRAYSKNSPFENYYLNLGQGICFNFQYTYRLPKRRLGLSASINYEKLDNNPILGPFRTKYENGQLQHVPIYMISLGIRYSLGRKKIH